MKDFIKMSKYAGMREDLVQAGGGNSAYKPAADRMVVKASGCQLADVTEESGYAVVNPQVIREAFLNCENPDGMTEEESKRILAEAFIEGERPSIETFLHSVSGRYSLHTHPVVVNALACRENGEDTIKLLFLDALVVPYATPGVQLAKVYFKAYREYRREKGQEPREIFLMNHGFFTSADTAEEVVRITERVTETIEEYLGVDHSGYHAVGRLQALFDDGIIWKVTDGHVLEAQRELGETWDPCFCPDCVVFLGKKMYAADKIPDRGAFDLFVEKNGYPSVLTVDGELYIHADSVKKALEVQSVLSFGAQVMLLNRGEACRMLPESEKDFLLGWDAEKYRKNRK